MSISHWVKCGPKFERSGYSHQQNFVSCLSWLSCWYFLLSTNVLSLYGDDSEQQPG